MGSAAIILMIITMLSKITGLIREQVTAFYLGTGLLTDVYSTATNIPFTIFSFVVAGVGTSFIPIYNQIKADKGVEEADKFTANLSNILFVLSAGISLLIMLFAPLLVKLFAPGYTPDKAILATKFSRIIAFSVTATAVSSVYIAYLNLKGKFTIPALTGMMMNSMHIVIFILAYKFNNFFIIAFGFLAAEYLKYILFPTTLKKQGYKHKFLFNIKDHNIVHMLVMSIPIIVSIAAVDISTIIDQSIASKLYQNSHGAVAALKFAILILQLVSGVIVVSIGTAMYPKLSTYAIAKEFKKLRKTLMTSIAYAQILVIPALVGLMVLAVPTIRLLFERGRFDAESTALTSGLLFFYLPSLFGLTIKDLTVRAFYSHRDIKTPVKVTVIQMCIQVVMSITLSTLFGIRGLPASTSISSISAGVIILLAYRKKYGRINLKKFAITIAKIIIASGIMAVATHFTFNALSGLHLIPAYILTVIVSALVYGIAIIFMGIPEVKHLVNIAYHKIKK